MSPPAARPAIAIVALALAAVVTAAVTACGSSDHAAQRSSSAAASSAAAARVAASAAAVQSSDNAELASWLTKEQADVTLAGQFGASMNLTETESSTQQAALAASCTAATEAAAATFPTDAAKRRSGQVAASDIALLADSLKQTSAFCALYDGGLQHELKIEADYAAFDQAYFYSGQITVAGKTYSCGSRCLTPDVSRYPAAADAYQVGATEAAAMATDLSSAPAPFSGSGWAQLWTALGQRLVQFGTYDTSYIAALRAKSAAAVTSSQQAQGAYIMSSESAINQQIAALNLFPAGVVTGYAAAVGGGVAAQFAYYGRYQLGVLAADQTSALATISAALR